MPFKDPEAGRAHNREYVRKRRADAVLAEKLLEDERTRKRKRYAEDPIYREKRLAMSRGYYKKNPQFKEQKLLSDASRRRNSWEFRMREMVYHAKKRAAKKGWKFNIDQAWMDQQVAMLKANPICPLSGVTMQLGEVYSGRSRFSPSLDRIDPKKGYTKDNLQVVSDWANRAKSDASMEEFKAFVRQVCTHLDTPLN